MASRTIAIGESSSSRYIGVKPPLDEAMAQRVCATVILPDWVELPDLGYAQRTDTDAPAHTEFGFDVSFGLDTLGPDTVDTSTVHVAQQVARLLRGMGDEVALLEGVYPTDFQTPLFGEAYFDMRRVHAYFDPQGEQR